MPAVARTDEEAWIAYPHLRHFFDKLLLSLALGHVCGPGGIPVPKPGQYVIRPVVNLRGLGAGASVVHMDPSGEADLVPPGFFWCEFFEGELTSHELLWDGVRWLSMSSWRGTLQPGRIDRFARWERSLVGIALPSLFDDLAECQRINVEAVGGRVIEVHLRPTPDPVGWDEFIPVWAEEAVALREKFGATHTFISDAIDDRFIGKRLGFYCADAP